MIFRRLGQLGAQSVERAAFSPALLVAHMAPLSLAGRREPHPRSGMDVEPCQCRSLWIMQGER